VSDTDYRSYDAEPEDSWHPLDHVDELLDNLRRRLAALGERFEWRAQASREERLGEIGARLARVRARHLEGRDAERVRLIEGDVDLIARRLLRGLIDALHGTDADRPDAEAI
jgi:hypothetical protein